MASSMVITFFLIKSLQAPRAYMFNSFVQLAKKLSCFS